MEKLDFKRLLYDIGRIIIALSLLLLLWFFLKGERIPSDILIWGLALFFLHFFEVRIPFFQTPLFYSLFLSAIFALNITTATLLSLFAPLKKSDFEEGRNYKEALLRLTNYIIAVQASGWVKRLLDSFNYSFLAWIFVPLVFFLFLFLFVFIEGKLKSEESEDIFKNFLKYIFASSLFSYFLFLSYFYSGSGGLVSLLFLVSIFISFYEKFHFYEEKLLSSFLKIATSLDEKLLHQSGMTELVFREGKKLLNEYGVKEKEALWALALFNLGLLPFSPLIRREGRLTREEFLKIKEHPLLLAQALREEGVLTKAAEIIKSHHESFSGTGYPEGKVGESIPFVSRVIHLLHAYAAMISPRPYRKAFTEERALKEIEHFSGVQFDPDVVKKFLSLREVKIEE